MRFAHVTNDGTGGSKFEERDVPQTKMPDAENVSPLLVSEALPASGVVFVTMPEEVRVTESHPAPRRQLVVVLEGQLEVETTDGEKRILTPGMIALVDDVQGLGHRTTVRSTGPVTFLAIPLKD